MAQLNKYAAALAASGLMLAQPAAATARAATPMSDSEALSDIPPGSGAVIGLLGLMGIVFLVMAISDGDDNDDDVPTSP